MNTSNIAVVLVIGLALGVFAGYYFGYDRGFERALVLQPTPLVTPVRVTSTPTPLPTPTSSPTPTTLVDPRIMAASLQLVGKWQSEEDSAFFREYKADATVVDSHDSVAGVVVTTDKWSLFTADTAEATISFQLNNNDTYIKHTSTTDPVYFRIVSVTPTTLEVVNMSKGGGLKFAKLP